MAVTQDWAVFCVMQPNKNLHFLGTLLASSCLALGTTFSAYAVAATSCQLPGALELFFTMVLAIFFIVAVVAVLIVLPGHYGFKAHPILAERICYSLGAMLVVWAASKLRLPAPVAPVLALAAGD